MKKHILYFLFVFLFLKCFAYEDLGDGIYIQKNINKSCKDLKIAMITLIIENENDYTNMVSFGTRSKELYAAKHGYDFIIGTEPLNTCFDVKLNGKLDYSWIKLALISKFIDQYDWIFWTDADSIILNFDCKLESFIDEKYDVIACTEDINLSKNTIYNSDIYINTGQIFYKNSEIAKKIVLGTWKSYKQEELSCWESTKTCKYIIDNKLSDFVLVYNPKYFNSNVKQYIDGDFLVHMYGYHELKGWPSLKGIMRMYRSTYGYLLEIQERIFQINNIKIDHYEKICTLDDYINKYGKFKIKGYSHTSYNSLFEYLKNLLQSNTQIKLIAEIGFNAGHSSEIFLKARQDIYVYSFDDMKHEYTPYGKECIDIKYPFRHVLFKNDLTSAILNFSNFNKDFKFDLIYINLGSLYNPRVLDILNFSKLAHENTIMIIDDMQCSSVIELWKKCITDRLITTGKIFKSKDSNRKWIQCKYVRR